MQPWATEFYSSTAWKKCRSQYLQQVGGLCEDCLEQGLYGWEVTDFKCTLVDGQHHTIHTHPLDFFVCTPMAFMNGLQDLGSTLLEPLLKMRITADASLLGKITGEMIRMQGEYDTPVFRGD